MSSFQLFHLEKLVSHGDVQPVNAARDLSETASDTEVALKDNLCRCAGAMEVDEAPEIRDLSARIRIDSYSRWWFGTFCIFPYIGDNHPN